MSLKFLMKSSGLAALAVCLSTTALPAAASAATDDARGKWSQRGNEARAARVERRGNFRSNRIDRRSENRASRVERRGDRRAQQVQNRTNDASPRVERWGDRKSAKIDRRSENRASRIERRGDNRADRVDRRSERVANRIENRNRSYSNSNRNRGYVGKERVIQNQQRYKDRRDWRKDNWRKDNWRDGRDYRSGYKDGYRDHRKWDRKWRKNNRYNWHKYRSNHRNTYRLGRYYAPYHNYSYRRLSIGFFLDSMFYSSRYWIDDPWQYRLPDVYGPYRWVRYYDDALLVDIYSGEVVDVIHDFFW